MCGGIYIMCVLIVLCVVLCCYACVSVMWICTHICIWCGMVSYVIVGYGMVWYGMVWCVT